MPAIPKIIGDFMELAFKSKICKVNVLETEMISSTLRKVIFKGTFPKVKFKIGQAIIIRIDDTNYRNYTPSKWDSDTGLFEVIFHIHGKGPGSQFIANLTTNDSVTVGLPRGFDIYKPENKYHFFFGDETCISVFKSLKDRINADQNNYLGILELDKPAMLTTSAIELAVDVVPKSSEKAFFAISMLHKLDSRIWELWESGYFYLMGNAKSIQAFRKVLKEKGVANKNIYTQAYWVEGKVGL